MFKFEKSIFINRPQQVVFDYITDLLNDAKWQGTIQSVALVSEGNSGAGSKWRYTSKFMGRTLESDVEMTGYNPPNGASLKAVGGPVPFENTYKFEAQDGGTLVSINGQAEIAGFFKLAEGLAKNMFEKQIDEDAETLKKVLEGS